MSHIQLIAGIVLSISSSAIFAVDNTEHAASVAGSALGPKSGQQYIYNNSNKTVTIELGDFFPTPYTLAPGESTVAYVTTDRQAIRIRSVG